MSADILSAAFLAVCIAAAFVTGCLLERFDHVTRGWFGASADHDYSRSHGDLDAAAERRQR